MKKLNFSCGTDIKKGWDNCDMQRDNRVIFCNADVFPYPFKKNAYDYVLLKECLYEFDKPTEVLFEIWRICKNGATIEIEVPYWNNKGAHTDMRTKYFFNENSFKYFFNNGPDIINRIKKFEIINIKLIPTPIGKFMPESLRNKLSVFISGLIAKINVRVKVIK